MSSPTLPTRGRPSSRPPTSPCPSSSLGSGMPTSATCRCWMETMGSYDHPKENQSCETLFSLCPSVASNMWVDRHLVKECRFLKEVVSWGVPQDNIQEPLFPVYMRSERLTALALALASCYTFYCFFDIKIVFGSLNSTVMRQPCANADGSLVLSEKVLWILDLN